MAHYDINCADCGGEYEASRKDAKYCPSCRLLRVLLYTAGRFGKKKCRVCKAEYRPSSTKDLRYCADCQPPSPTAKTITCAICKMSNAAHERVAVCTGCVKGVETQAKVIRALKRGRQKRKDRATAERQARERVLNRDRMTDHP